MCYMKVVSSTPTVSYNMLHSQAIYYALEDIYYMPCNQVIYPDISVPLPLSRK